MILRKKALALAVAGAIGVPVAALAQSNVELYGKLYPQFGVVSGSGATAAGTAGLSSLVPASAVTGLEILKRGEVEASNSRFGVRGSEDLGGGVRAIYQIESRVNIDVGSTILASRDSFVGIDVSQYGTVKLGNMDTVYKNIGDPLRFLGISSGNFVSTSNIISKPGFGTNAASSFHIRRANSVYYESPKFAGVQVLGQYSPGEAAGNPGANGLNAYLTAFGVQYKQGNLSVGVATETHNDFFGASSNLTGAIQNSTTGANNEHSKDTANRAAVMYRFGDTRVALDLTSMKYNESVRATSAGKFESYKHNAWALVADQKMGAWTGAVEYASSAAGSCSRVAGVACDTSGLSGKMFSVGALYSFSKTAGMFLLYSRLTNGDAAIYNNTANVTPTPGMDITQVAVGVLYAFGGSGGGD
jgi:predicted porin